MIIQGLSPFHPLTIPSLWLNNAPPPHKRVNNSILWSWLMLKREVFRQFDDSTYFWVCLTSSQSLQRFIIKPVEDRWWRSMPMTNNSEAVTHRASLAFFGLGSPYPIRRIAVESKSRFCLRVSNDNESTDIENGRRPPYREIILGSRCKEKSLTLEVSGSVLGTSTSILNLELLGSRWISLTYGVTDGLSWRLLARKNPFEIPQWWSRISCLFRGKNTKQDLNTQRLHLSIIYEKTSAILILLWRIQQVE